MATQQKTSTSEAENVNRISDAKALIPKAILKKFTLFLFLSLFISNGNLFAQIIFVEDIINVPDTAIVGVPLPLTGTVIPANATFQNIIWSIFDAGTTGATLTGNTLNTTAEGTAVVKAKITESMTGDGFTKNFAIQVFVYVPVEDIINVPDTAIVGVPLLLTGTVMPENASHQNIVWSVFHAGSTGATITENTLHTNSAGTVTLTAKIDETLVGTSFTKIFMIEVSNYIPVEDIIGVPDTVIVGVPLPLTATVIPENASHQNIIWTVSDAGTTEATIIENTLHTNSAGTLTLTAKIDETLVGETFTKNFIIEVTELVGINDLELANITIYPNPTTGELRITGIRHSALDAESPTNKKGIAGQARNDIRVVEIIDVMGRAVTVETWRAASLHETLNISLLSPGIYFVIISTDTGKVVRKVVKQ